MVTFRINEEEKVVVCLITTEYLKSGSIFSEEFDVKTFVGKAKCNPEDEFSIEKGKKIAKLRALIKIKKLEIKAYEEACRVVSKIFVQKNERKNNIIKNLISLSDELKSLTE